MNKKQFNASVAKILSENIHKFKDGNDRVAWSDLVGFVRQQAPRYVGLSYNRIRGIYRAYERGTYDYALNGEHKQDIEIEVNDKPTFERTGNNARGNMKVPSDINPMDLDLEHIVKIFKLDTSIWECTGFQTKAWNPTIKDKDSVKGYKQPTSWSVSAKFSRRKDYKPSSADLKHIFKEAREMAIRQRRHVKKISQTKKNAESNNVFVPLIYDLHLGKLSWAGETGENYDLKIAYDRALSTFKQLIDRALHEGFDKVILQVGNDFFQYDDDKSQTNHGTRVDSDVRWQKLFQRGVMLYREMIEYAAQFAVVDVIWTPGNHDTTMSFFAFEALRGYYSTDPNVHIDNDIKRRSYRLEGFNLLGFAHGDKVKKIEELVQLEARSFWGQARYVEILIGHWHREQVKEDRGITIRVGSSLSGTDSWHYEKGFVGSRIAAQGIIYKRDHIGPYTIYHQAVDLENEPGQE